MYVIIARYVADSYRGLVTQKGEVKTFSCENSARKFGKENLEISRYVAEWEAVTKTEAQKRGYEIN